MNAAAWLPPPPAPPHDPTSWRLNGRTGWRRAGAAPGIPAATKALIEAVVERPGVLGLAGAPGSGRSLTEPTGSFGGLRPPANVAVGSDGTVWLLDRPHARLKRFDPCECVFKTVPCFAGEGTGARQLQAPQSIAVCGLRLYVADTGNQRVSVFALNGFVLLEHWKTPAAAQLAGPWEPWSILIDAQARAWVSDRVHGVVHRFRPGGAWERSWPGLGVVTWLAADCDGRVYAVVEGVTPAVVRLDEDGLARPVPSEADRAPGAFPCLPFEVGVQGEIWLGECCAPAPCTCGQADAGARGVFDLEGLPLTDPPPLAAPAYVKQGVVFSEALDSELYRCTWHRVRLCGRLPPGARLEVLTFTSEVELSAAEVQGLPESAWATRARVESFALCEWDGLIRSPAGRYLWLKLVLGGDGTGTPVLSAIEVEFPRISLRRYLPAVFGAEPLSADFTDRFLAVFDQTWRGIERQIDDQARLFDPGSAPADRPPGGIDFLSWLASWIGVTLDRHWPEARRRLFVQSAARLYSIRGTAYGLWRQLLLFLGLDAERCCCPHDAPRDRCTPRPLNCALPAAAACHWQPPPLILEHFKLRRWLFLGAGRLGSEAELWGKRIVGRSPLGEGAQVGGTRLATTPDPLRDPFHVYAHRFSVFVPACVKRSDSLRKGLENLLRAESPASAAYEIRYVEPRFRIGFQSMVGLDAVIARVPQGVALGRTTLGAGSVLPSAPPAGPGLAVGKQARIGSTTTLGGNQ